MKFEKPEQTQKTKFEKPATKQSQIAACMVTPFKARVVTACWNQYLMAV